MSVQRRPKKRRSPPTLDSAAGVVAPDLWRAAKRWPAKWRWVVFSVLFFLGFAGLAVREGVADYVGAKLAGSINQETSMAASPAPTLTPNPLPTRTLPAVRIDYATLECAAAEGSSSHDYIEVEFESQKPDSGRFLWAFALARGNPRWYPSGPPWSDGEMQYEARVFVGTSDEFFVYIVVLETSGLEQVTQYLAQREVDKRWSLGMTFREQDSAVLSVRARQRVLGGCRRIQDSVKPPAAAATPDQK
jgi:hypothetical protein